MAAPSCMWQMCRTGTKQQINSTMPPQPHLHHPAPALSRWQPPKPSP